MKRRLMFGVMQGRLINKGGFCPQQFPWDTWEEEFAKARTYGIGYIEWMFNAERFEDNPIWTEAGRKRIRGISESQGVKISSVCANYFMQNGICEIESMDVMRRLTEAGMEIGVKQLVVPMFGASVPKNLGQIIEFAKDAAELLEDTKIRLCIESDLPAAEQKEICAMAGNDKVGICYDTGNAAGNGYDCVEDISLLGDILYELHIKDKHYGGESVMLGKGAVHFSEVFLALSKNSEVTCILESKYEEDAEKDTVKNINYIRNILREKGV